MAQPRSPALRVPGPPVRIGAGVSPPPRDDPAAALNQVLNEVIDAILDVRQAYRRVLRRSPFTPNSTSSSPT